MLHPFLERGRLEAGIDEAGRGCLAGPVVAAAVILPEDFYLKGLNDSKKLRFEQREHFRKILEQEALAWAIGIASVSEIDSINILRASFLAMERAVQQLLPEPDFLLIDGNRFRTNLKKPFLTVVGGDGTYASIAAASVFAKTERDRIMDQLHHQFPAYSWNANKGYGTEKHVEAMQRFGRTQHHRKSFTVQALQPGLFNLQNPDEQSSQIQNRE